MGRRKQHTLTAEELIQIIKDSGICSKNEKIKQLSDEESLIENLPERIQQIQQLINKHNPKQHTMLYFVMYDIENNKIRRLVAKYLERKGLIRIQKSIFVADTDRITFDEIRQTLKEVQEAYDNNDSIVLVPIAADDLRAMKIIGKNIDLDIILGNQHTLFF